MELCPYDQTPLDVVGKKEYIGSLISTGIRVKFLVHVRVFYLCHTCGKHFHQWADPFESEELEIPQ